MTLIIIAVLALIVLNLFIGLFYLLTDHGKTKRNVNALTWRIGLTAALLVFLVVAFVFGWIKPHGVMPQQTQTQTQTS
ncbi:MAG: twin transmembrane helix small protein [Gammaproteobacteria bacterium]|nr:twin transmembrane helix small protein [Gammaproteobacteria bacterium]